MKFNFIKKLLFLLIICVIFNIFTFDKINVSASYTSEIVIDFESGRILHFCNENQKRLIASTTKILTCITAIENCDISKTVQIKADWCNKEGSSIYLKEGEIYTVEQLLYGMMLRSGNDSACAVACAVSGNEKNFVELMNKTAKQAGAIDSHFENPHGLDHENHYSTAKDLAFITRYALKNPIFKKIVGTKKFVFDKGVDRVVWYNKNKLLNGYENAIGVKTGYTKKAGRCLVSASEKNGQIIICVVLDCAPMYERSESLLESCYEKYEYCELLSSEQSVANLTLKNGLSVPCFVATDEYYPLTKEEQNKIEKVVKFDENISFPLKFSQKVGIIQIYLEKQLLFERKLYTII